MSNRPIFTFPARGLGTYRLEAVDVTDPTIHATYPYQLVRTGMAGQQVTLMALTRLDLVALGDALLAELGGLHTESGGFCPICRRGDGGDSEAL